MSNTMAAPAGQVRVLGEKEWLSRKEASRYLFARGMPITPECLARWGNRDNSGDGPSYTHTRNKVAYHKADLDDWIRRNSKRIE